MTGQLDLLMFLALVVVIMSGFPVAFSIAGVAVLFACLGWLTGAMDISRNRYARRTRRTHEQHHRIQSARDHLECLLTDEGAPGIQN